MSLRKSQTFFACSLLALVAAACGGTDDAPADDSAQVRAQAVKNYSSIVHASYEDSAQGARDLDDAIGALVADPTEDTLGDARTAWRAAREPYLQTEVYRFYDGPIDNPTDGPEGLINAWPLDESYIDYVENEAMPEAGAMAGIINDPETDITAEELEALNEQGGEENIATGFHAVEFLLWGQDQSEDGPGARPATDYVTGGSGTAANQDRRAEYLTTVSSLLVGHLEDLVAAWEPDATYRAELESVESSEALRRIMSGMIVLSGFETGGERVKAAYDSGDQEDEHSCFSDNTHRDMVQDVQGVLNVWRGSYTRTNGDVVSGPGIRDVVRLKNAALAEHIEDHIVEALEAAEALEPPFDREIALDNDDGRLRVEELMNALTEVEEALAEGFEALGLTIPETE
jgi:putative iron-regulated protein